MHLDPITFSSLVALAEPSASFHVIDLYIHAQMDSITHTKIAGYEGLMTLIEQGRLVIHVQETAPSNFRSVW